MLMVSELAIVVNDIGTSYSAWYSLCVIAHNVAYLILGEGASAQIGLLCKAIIISQAGFE